MDELVLVGGDAERSVFVGDPGEHRIRPGLGVLYQHAREGRDGAGQGLLLLSAGLVSPVEQIPPQLGSVVEEIGVEELGDITDGRADDRQRGADDRGGLLGEHSDS